MNPSVMNPGTYICDLYWGARTGAATYTNFLLFWDGKGWLHDGRPVSSGWRIVVNQAIIKTTPEEKEE